MEEHYSVDWKVWSALNATRSQIAAISPHGSMRCDAEATQEWLQSGLRGSATIPAAAIAAIAAAPPAQPTKPTISSNNARCGVRLLTVFQGRLCATYGYHYGCRDKHGRSSWHLDAYRLQGHISMSWQREDNCVRFDAWAAGMQMRSSSAAIAIATAVATAIAASATAACAQPYSHCADCAACGWLGSSRRMLGTALSPVIRMVAIRPNPIRFGRARDVFFQCAVGGSNDTYSPTVVCGSTKGPVSGVTASYCDKDGSSSSSPPVDTTPAVTSATQLPSSYLQAAMESRRQLELIHASVPPPSQEDAGASCGARQPWMLCAEWPVTSIGEDDGQLAAYGVIRDNSRPTRLQSFFQPPIGFRQAAADNEWVGVTRWPNRCIRQLMSGANGRMVATMRWICQQSYGVWFAGDSGIWLNLGKTRAFSSRSHAQRSATRPVGGPTRRRRVQAATL